MRGENLKQARDLPLIESNPLKTAKTSSSSCHFPYVAPETTIEAIISPAGLSQSPATLTQIEQNLSHHRFSDVFCRVAASHGGRA